MTKKHATCSTTFVIWVLQIKNHTEVSKKYLFKYLNRQTDNSKCWREREHRLKKLPCIAGGHAKCCGKLAVF